MKIVIGKSGKHDVSFDLKELLATRLLIQANSGGGKSFLLRRLMEQAFGKVQIICIDPEGEFATLREKFGFVLVGEGGETPADVRSAGMLAEKLLELRASAVCDLYEAFRSHPMQRREWVRRFLTALIDAPRKLWHPLLVIVDEAHKFCPQETPKAASMVEREIISGCKESMIAVATTGRKRGFCAVWATQRLAKADKDATAELFNRLVGMTIEDVDVERAADLMSVAKADRHEFKTKLRTLSPGEFFAFGRAISKERVLIKVGDIQTTHPKLGDAAKQSGPPPAPDEVKKLLPNLADLPQEAEHKEKTEKQLKAEVSQLKADLRKAQQQKTGAQTVAKEVKVADPRAIDAALKQRDREYQQREAASRSAIAKLQSTLQTITAQAAKAANIEIPKFEKPVSIHLPPLRMKTPMPQPPAPPARNVQNVQNGDGSLSGPEQRILNAIAWMNTIGVEEPEQTAVAFLAGYTYGGGAFNNPRGALNTKGLVQYSGERIRLTEEGKALAKAPDAPLDAEELQRRVLQRLPGPEQKILTTLISAYPNSLANEECAQQSGYAPDGGAFNNPKGRLRSLGLVEYPERGQVKAKSLLFLEAS